MPACVMPIEDLISLCQDHGRTLNYHCHTLVDGAHAVGNIPISMKKINPDYYTSNCHKWLCTSKGAAFLYAKREHQQCLIPAVTSHGHEKGFLNDFGWAGTTDVSSFLSIVPAVRFFTSLGLTRLLNRNRQLAHKAAVYLAAEWQTSLVIPEAHTCALSNIWLPEDSPFEATAEEANTVNRLLRDRYNVEAVIQPYQGRLLTRISSHM